MKNKFFNLLQKSLETQKIIVIFSLCALILLCSFSFANTPFVYNIIPEKKVNSIVDTKNEKKLSFKVLDANDEIFYNGKKVKVKDNKFEIDVSKISGNKSLEFTNANNEKVSFEYKFSSKNGKLEEYDLVPGKTLNVFVTTHKNIKILYTDKEKSAVSKLKNYINKMPSCMLTNLDMIKLVPYSNTKNIAGTTKDKTITLYNFSKYSSTTQKNIIYHETAHTWANILIDEKRLDYSYSKYDEIVKKDNSYVSNYAKDFANTNNGRLSEDFADAVAFYIMNQKTFAKQYPNRTLFLKELMK